MNISPVCILARLALSGLVLVTGSAYVAAQNAENVAKKAADLPTEKKLFENVREQRPENRALGANNLHVKLGGASTIARVGIRVDNTTVIVALEVPAEAPQQKQPALPVDGQPAVPQQPAPPRIARIEPASFDQLVFGSGANAAAARVKLLSQLRKKIEDADLTCRLSEAQQKKVKLAGRGDIQRYFERVEELKVRSQSISVNGDGANVRNWLTCLHELCREAEPLRRVLDTGPFDDNSLFAKTLKKSFSAEQAAQFAAQEARASQKSAVKSSQKAKSAK